MEVGPVEAKGWNLWFHGFYHWRNLWFYPL